MAIRNNHWYNINEQHFYPLDDKASAISNEGEFLPSSLISDLRLRWPITYGQFAFISAASITNHLITILIEATNTLDPVAGQTTLIAGITLPKSELSAGRTYTLTAFKPKVGGFIVIGSNVSANYSGTFSSPRQSLLTPRAARYSRVPPVQTIGINNTTNPLSGLVNLVALSPLQLTKETRVINGVEETNVIVLRLVDLAQDVNRAAANESIFATFAGDCGKRVGSKTCGDPQPIQTINGIGADCDGVLTLDFRGCALVGKNVTDCGVVVDCNLGLASSCLPPYLPNLTTGELPSEAPPIIITPPLPPQPPIPIPNSISESVQTILALPYCDTFDEAFAYFFNPIGASSFGFISDDSPEENFCCSGPPPADTSYGCASNSISESGHWYPAPIIASSYGAISQTAQAVTNISLFTGDVQSLYRRFTTDFKITQGVVGSLKNAGIIVNYRLATATLYNYLLALLDIDNSRFGIYFFNGNVLIALTQVTVPEAVINDWYRLTFELTPNLVTKTSINLEAVLTGVTDPMVSYTLNTSLSTTFWVTDAANSGFYAKRSRSYFSFWRIDEVTP
jgi:hypothetical protein